MQWMGVGQDAPRYDEFPGDVEVVEPRAGQQHRQRKDHQPADDERHDDAPEPVPGGTAEAVTLQQHAAKKPAMA